MEWDKERGTKTRTGENSYFHQRAFNPRAYETKTPRFLVLLYEKFISLHPDDSKESDSPFFLTVVPAHKIQNDIWYCSRPLGKNSLSKFMSEAKLVQIRYNKLQSQNPSDQELFTIMNHQTNEFCYVF